MKSSIFYYSFCCLLVFSQSCKNKDCKETGTCPAENYRFVLGEAKPYIWSKPGSYWIYKNTKTGDMDTQICTGVLFDTLIKKGSENYSKQITIVYDKYARAIESSFNKWKYIDETLSPDPDGISFNGEYRIILVRTVSGEGEITPFFHPFRLNAFSGNGSSNTEYVGMDTTLVLQGKTYQNVARFELDRDDIWETKLECKRANTIYYWAKDVGLIKKEVKTCNYNWELVDYHIIQ